MLLATAAPAHADLPTALDEADFLARFEKADPRFDVLAARVESSQADVAAAGVRANPSIAFDREEVWGGGSSFADNFGTLEIPLDISGARSRRIKAARTGVAAARAEGELDTFVLRLDALEVYYAGAYARLQVETLRAGRDALAALVEVVRTRRAAGDASGYDVGRLELELDAYDDAIVEAEITLASARRRIAALVGEPDKEFDAAGALSVATPADLAVASARDRGDYRAAILRADAAASDVAAASRGWVPGLTLTGGIKTTDLGDDTAFGYVAGIALEIPLFDHGQGARARASARRRTALAEAKAIESVTTTAVAVADEELRRRLAQAERYDAGPVAKLADLLRRAETAYREGDRPIVELLDAHRSAREVRLRQLEIRYETKKAELARQRAVGHR